MEIICLEKLGKVITKIAVRVKQLLRCDENRRSEAEFLVILYTCI